METEKTKEFLRAKVDEGKQVVLVALFASNTADDAGALIDSQLEIVTAMAKNVLQLAGCEVDACASAVRLTDANTDDVAILSATLSTERN